MASRMPLMAKTAVHRLCRSAMARLTPPSARRRAGISGKSFAQWVSLAGPEDDRQTGGDDPPQPPIRGQRIMTKNQINALLLTAALSGLVGGTSVAAKAATNGSAKVRRDRRLLLAARTRPRLPNTPVKAKTIVARAPAAAPPATRAARARTPARARAAAPPTAPSHPRLSSLRFPDGAAGIENSTAFRAIDSFESRNDGPVRSRHLRVRETHSLRG
jgi:hypothetical protein